jgi:phage recombination protein Bet
MSTDKALVPQRASALAVMASRYDMEPVNLMNTLKNTVFKGASNEQLGALVIVANQYNLNPFLREVYAFPDKAGGIVAVVGVDGWMRIVNEHKNFNGCEFEFDDGSCTCTMHVKGREHPVRVTEYLDECKRNSDAWRNMPRRMLRHRAFIQAARLAFGFSSLKDEDDVIDITATVAPMPTFKHQEHPASVTVTAPVPDENPNQVAAPDPEPTPASDDGGLGPQAAKVVQAPEPEPAPAPATAKPTEAPEKARADLLSEFFVTECSANYSQVVGTLVRLGCPKNADSFASFADMPEKELMKVWSARRGLVAEVKRDMGK